MKSKETRHYSILVLIFCVYLITLIIVNPWGNFPLDDDWVYARDCILSSNAGQLVLTGFESAWGIPQIIVGILITKLFGFSHIFLRLFGVITLAATFVMIDIYLRNIRVPSKTRLITCAAFIFNPVSYILSLTFMTDMPFLFFWMLACFFGTRHW